MKTGIHPEVFDAVVTCSGCGTAYALLSTKPEMRVEICSNCHPFYTGQGARIVDTEGRVEKFVKKFEGKKTRVSKRKRKQEAAEVEKAALIEREAQAAAAKKAAAEEAREKRAEERSARQRAQEEKTAEADAKSPKGAPPEEPSPAPPAAAVPPAAEAGDGEEAAATPAPTES
jgi:large subunit ribosomal protein L31